MEESAPRPLSVTISFADVVPFFGLALQFGLQPTLNKSFINSGVSNTVLIIVTEVIKVALSLFVLWITTSANDRNDISQSLSWNVSVRRAGVPAFLYSIQNWLILLGARHISPLTMSILNQTKTLSAAFFAYIWLGKKQSFPQLVALLGLFVGAVLIVTAESDNNMMLMSLKKPTQSTSWIGFLAVGCASLLSGASSAASERALSAPIGSARVPRLATSLIFSIELALFGIATLVMSALIGANPDRMVFSDPFRQWSLYTLIPVLSNASGGIFVGIITQRAGGVKKGLSLILGICFATLIEAALGNKPLNGFHASAVLLVGTSMWLYFSYPYAPREDQDKKER